MLFSSHLPCYQPTHQKFLSPRSSKVTNPTTFHHPSTMLVYTFIISCLGYCKRFLAGLCSNCALSASIQHRAPVEPYLDQNKTQNLSSVCSVFCHVSNYSSSQSGEHLSSPQCCPLPAHNRFLHPPLCSPCHSDMDSHLGFLTTSIPLLGPL